MSANETPLILSIETATRAGSVAVSRGKSLRATRAGDPAVSHSSHLLHYIRDVLEEASVTLANVDLFAVATGPGSFTGLRIGLATVKSFAATLGRPCAAVPTLHAVAHAAGEATNLVALLPAGRGELFAQLLSVTRNGAVNPLEAPAHLPPGRLLEKVKMIRPLHWAGEGARIHARAIQEYAASEGIQFWDEVERGLPGQSCEDCWTLARSPKVLAGEVAVLASMIWQRGEAVPPERLQANYVRPSDAEINEQCRE